MLVLKGEGRIRAVTAGIEWKVILSSFRNFRHILRSLHILWSRAPSFKKTMVGIYAVSSNRRTKIYMTLSTYDRESQVPPMIPEWPSFVTYSQKPYSGYVQNLLWIKLAPCIVSDQETMNHRHSDNIQIFLLPIVMPHVDKFLRSLHLSL